jgi:aspartyl-tRNA(Asn)/glutamyl-tRNA(Gln) amidotransferase subunit C
MLARLGLTDSEVARMGEQLAQVLDYIAALQRIDTSDVPPTAHAAGVEDIMRTDEPRASLPNQVAISNATAVEGEFFRVPAVLDDDAPDLTHAAPSGGGR